MGTQSLHLAFSFPFDLYSQLFELREIPIGCWLVEFEGKKFGKNKFGKNEFGKNKFGIFKTVYMRVWYM